MTFAFALLILEMRGKKSRVVFGALPATSASWDRDLARLRRHLLRPLVRLPPRHDEGAALPPGLSVLRGSDRDCLCLF